MNREQRKEYRRNWMREHRREQAEREQSREQPCEQRSTASSVDNVLSTTNQTSLETLRTPTDALFEADQPGYYIYQTEERTGHCRQCGKHFTTRLELNRFCSPSCKREFVNSLSTLRVHAR